MKKIINILGLIFLVIIVILNIMFTANLDSSEHIEIRNNNIMYILSITILAILIVKISDVINKKLDNVLDSKKIKKIVFIVIITLFAIFNILWCIFVRPAIVGDQIHACNIAQTFYRGNLEEFLPNMTYAGIPLSEYMQSYHQQISLSFIFSIFFRFIHFDGIGALRALNVIGNVAILIALYLINKNILKQYKTNIVLFFILTVTFISLTMLSTFIYGDIPSLALCLFSVYNIMKYREKGAIKYPIIASILTMIAFMMRMNSLIFIIATVMYLIFALLENFNKRTTKENAIKIAIILMYIIIAIYPSTLVKTYYLNKYNLDKNKKYPNISYFLMAMEESHRGNGWYNEARGEYALKNPENAKSEYAKEIKNRLIYFGSNIGDMFEFYTKKLASMWTENTYSAVRNNMEGQTNQYLEKIIEPLTFYQKTLLLITCTCAIIVLIKQRKNKSLDILFLLTIFIGGFLFHIIWEAKSRYILPYIIVLIPIASLYQPIINIKEKIKNNVHLK